MSPWTLLPRKNNLLDVGKYRRVVGGPFKFARLDVDDAGRTSRRQFVRQQDMVDTHAAAAAEQRLGFVDDALAARAQMLKSGLGFDAQEVHTYLKARMSDKAAPKPKATSWQI